MTPRIKIQAEDFDAAAEIAALRPGAGAVASFVGLVRGEEGLTALSIEHYPAMTQKQIARIAAEAASRWPLTGLTVIHRIGRLEPGAQIVLVAAAAAHRGEAFTACEFLMDYLKAKAPFWKQEEFGAVTRWVEARSGDDAAAARWKK
jgi:molybdopterin synthase catalytic subunit